MDITKDSFHIKPSSIRRLTTYLCTDFRRTQFSDGTVAWTLGTKSYISKAFQNLKARVKREGCHFNKKSLDVNYSTNQLFATAVYCVGMEFSTECDDQQTKLFYNLVGILRCNVELGRIDITFEI